MLKTHANMYNLPQTYNNTYTNKPAKKETKNFEPGFADSPRFQLSNFYTVALSYDKKVLDIKNEPPTIHTNEDLENLALKIIDGDKNSGAINSLIFYKTDKGGYLLVTLMDNTVINESAGMLFRYTLIFGGIAIIIFFFFSVFIARKIVEPLEISYQKQKQFISDAGHELKTPISVVNTNAELLSREIGNNQWLSNIQYENERMGILVSQLLNLARTESTAPQMEYLDFSRLVAGETLPFESVAFEKGLSLNSTVSEQIMLTGNSSQLKQLVSILLDNAIRHSHAGGEICLNLTKEHNIVKLSVINNADAIPKEHQTQLFERFYRVDSVRNGDEKHYGLGLAIAKAIVTSHKGDIDVFCYNQLVEFKVQLPII